MATAAGVDDYSLDPFQTEEDVLDTEKKIALARILRQGVAPPGEDISSRYQRNRNVSRGYQELATQDEKRKSLSDRYTEDMVDALRRSGASDEIIEGVRSPGLRKEYLAQHAKNMDLARSNREQARLGGTGGDITYQQALQWATSSDPPTAARGKVLLESMKPQNPEYTTRITPSGGSVPISGAQENYGATVATKARAEDPFKFQQIEGGQGPITLPNPLARSILAANAPGAPTPAAQGNPPAPGVPAPPAPVPQGPPPMPVSAPPSPVSAAPSPLAGAVAATGGPVGTTTPPQGKLVSGNPALDGFKDIIKNGLEERRLLQESQTNGDTVGAQRHQKNLDMLSSELHVMEKKHGFDARQVAASMSQEGQQPQGALPQATAAAGGGVPSPISSAQAAPAPMPASPPTARPGMRPATEADLTGMTPNPPSGPTAMPSAPAAPAGQKLPESYLPPDVIDVQPNAGLGRSNPKEQEAWLARRNAQQEELKRYMATSGALSENRSFINEFRQINEGDTYSGPWQTGKWIDQLKQSINRKADVPITDATKSLDSISANFKAMTIKQFGQNPSDNDLKVISESVPSSEDSYAGRILKLNRMEYALNRREASAPLVQKWVAQGVPVDVARNAATNWYDDQHGGLPPLTGRRAGDQPRNPTQAASGQASPPAAGSTESPKSPLYFGKYGRGSSEQLFPAAKDTVKNMAQGVLQLAGQGDRVVARSEKERQALLRKTNPDYDRSRTLTDIALNPATYVAGVGPLRGALAMGLQGLTQPGESIEDQFAQGAVGAALGGVGGLVSKVIPSGQGTAALSPALDAATAMLGPKVGLIKRALKGTVEATHGNIDKLIGKSETVKHIVDLLRRGVTITPADYERENR